MGARDKISQAFRNLKRKSHGRSTQALLSCSSTSQTPSLERPQSLAISDCMSSINCDRSSQAVSSCSSTSQQLRLEKPQNLAIPDRMSSMNSISDRTSSINSVDVARFLGSCFPACNSGEDSNPIEHSCTSEIFDMEPTETISMSICYDNLDKKYGSLEAIPYRYTSKNQFS